MVLGARERERRGVQEGPRKVCARYGLDVERVRVEDERLARFGADVEDALDGRSGIRPVAAL